MMPQKDALVRSNRAGIIAYYQYFVPCRKGKLVFLSVQENKIPNVNTPNPLIFNKIAFCAQSFCGNCEVKYAVPPACIIERKKASSPQPIPRYPIDY